MASRYEPIACSLTPTEARSQLGEWSELRRHATRVDSRPTGMRMHFPVAMRPMVEDLVRREAGCCSFLEFACSTNGDEFVVDVSSPDPDARPVITLLTGAAGR